MAGKTQRQRFNVTSFERWKLLTYARKSHRVINSGTQSSKHPIQSCYADCGNVNEQLIDEEFGDVDVEVGHEIHDDPENHDLNKDDRKVQQYSSNHDRGRSIESVLPEPNY